jgi:hypothetical protein
MMLSIKRICQSSWPATSAPLFQRIKQLLEDAGLLPAVEAAGGARSRTEKDSKYGDGLFFRTVPPMKCLSEAFHWKIP